MADAELKILFLGNAQSCQTIHHHFLTLHGVPLPTEKTQGDYIKISSLALRKSTKEEAQVSFHICLESDEYEGAQRTIQWGPDFVFVDERHSSNSNPAMSLEQFLWGVERCGGRDFNFASQRIVVITDPSPIRVQREMQLSFKNVRAVTSENIEDILLMIAKEWQQCQEKHRKISLCISGGGVEGYIYSLGALKAIEDCMQSKSLNDFDIYCGVSSGALLAAALASGASLEELQKQIERKDSKFKPLQLSTIFDPAFAEITKRFFSIFRAAPTRDIALWISKLQEVVPVGFFRGEKLKKFLESQIQEFGISDHFSAVPKELYINVTDQDTGESIVLGKDPWRDIKVSQAIRASTALPPFYLPEKINGHWFTDGQLTSGPDIPAAIEKGAGLILYIDPIVPYVSNNPGEILKRGGYFTLLQAVKSLIETRSQSFLQKTMADAPDVDFLVFRPTNQAMASMAGNPMKYHFNLKLIDQGYHATLESIVNSYDSIAHKFQKAGIKILPLKELQKMLASR